MISSREVENVWNFHNFRSGSSLSVHDSHAFQRTPGPATLSRAESVHSVSWRNRSFRRSSRKHPPIYKHCMQMFFDCLLWSLIRWTDIPNHFSEEHLQGNYGKPEKMKVETFSESFRHLPWRGLFYAVVNFLMSLLIYALMTMLKLPPTNNITTSAL